MTQLYILTRFDFLFVVLHRFQILWDCKEFKTVALWDKFCFLFNTTIHLANFLLAINLNVNRFPLVNTNKAGPGG